MWMMSGAARRHTLARMSQAGEPVDLRAERIREWQDAGDRVVRAYRARCSSTRSDRHKRYVRFLDALRQEARAAWQVGGARSGQGADDPTCQQGISPEQANDVAKGPNERKHHGPVDK